MSDLPIAKRSIHWCVNYPEKAAKRIAELEAENLELKRAAGLVDYDDPNAQEGE